MDANAKCETCVYWKAGECRQAPPQVTVQLFQLRTSWPTTRPDDYCGAWVKKL